MGGKSTSGAPQQYGEQPWQMGGYRTGPASEGGGSPLGPSGNRRLQMEQARARYPQGVSDDERQYLSPADQELVGITGGIPINARALPGSFSNTDPGYEQKQAMAMQQDRARSDPSTVQPTQQPAYGGGGMMGGGQQQYGQNRPVNFGPQQQPQYQGGGGGGYTPTPGDPTAAPQQGGMTGSNQSMRGGQGHTGTPGMLGGRHLPRQYGGY